MSSVCTRRPSNVALQLNLGVSWQQVSVYVTIWEFTVRGGAEPAFEQLYGPAGAWVALFRTASGYLGTELLRPVDASRRYLTLDRWESAVAYAAFRRDHAAEYQLLDTAGDALTEMERFVGEFTLAAS